MAQHSSRSTLGLAISDYLDWHALRGSSARHRTDLARSLKAFVAAAGPDLTIEQVTREHCSAFLRSFQEKGRKPNTVEAYHRVLDAFFRWLMEEERLSASPMKRVPKPKIPQEQIKPLTPEELARLLAQPDRSTFTGVRDAAFMGLLADTGLQLSEALSIRLCDVDYRQRSISVMGKGGKPRTVFFGEQASALLRTYLRRRGQAGGEDPLFVNSLGERLHRFCMSHRISAYGKAAGIHGKRVSPHTLRHTFAVSWLMGGGDALSLQRLMGHSTSAMTSRYVNFAPGDLAQLHHSVSPLDRLKDSPAAGQQPAPGARRRLR